MNGPGAAPSRLLLGVCGLLLAAAGTEAGYLSWRVHGLKKTLAQASGQSQELEHTREAMSRRWEELQGKYEQLLRDHGSLAEEKSNLVAALTHTQAQLERHRQLAAERDVLEASLKQVGEERHALLEQMAALDAQLDEAKQAGARLAQDQAKLKQALARAEKRSQEKELKVELAAQRKEAEELRRVAASAQREAAEAERTEATRTAQLQKLQKDYAKVVTESNRIKHEARTVPQDISQMAREHQRLIKETADMHYNLGVLFTKSRQYSQAAAEFRKVLELRPDDGDAYYNLGVIYAEHLPDRDKALALFRRYLQINPDARDASWVKQYIASWQAWEAKERLE